MKEKGKMKIYPLGIDVKICSSFLSKIKGMMFLSKKSAKPLLFVFDEERNVLIHMWFVFFPLLVIWVDKNRIVQECKILRPFSNFNHNFKSKYVLEIPLIKSDRGYKTLKRKLKKKLKLKFSL